MGGWNGLHMLQILARVNSYIDCIRCWEQFVELMVALNWSHKACIVGVWCFDGSRWREYIMELWISETIFGATLCILWWWSLCIGVFVTRIGRRTITVNWLWWGGINNESRAIIAGIIWADSAVCFMQIYSWLFVTGLCCWQVVAVRRDWIQCRSIYIKTHGCKGD